MGSLSSSKQPDHLYIFCIVESRSCGIEHGKARRTLRTIIIITTSIKRSSTQPFTKPEKKKPNYFIIILYERHGLFTRPASAKVIIYIAFKQAVDKVDEVFLFPILQVSRARIVWIKGSFANDFFHPLQRAVLDPFVQFKRLGRSGLVLISHPVPGSANTCPLTDFAFNLQDVLGNVTDAH